MRPLLLAACLCLVGSPGCGSSEGQHTATVGQALLASAERALQYFSFTGNPENLVAGVPEFYSAWPCDLPATALTGCATTGDTTDTDADGVFDAYLSSFATADCAQPSTTLADGTLTIDDEDDNAPDYRFLVSWDAVAFEVTAADGSTCLIERDGTIQGSAAGANFTLTHDFTTFEESLPGDTTGLTSADFEHSISILAVSKLSVRYTPVRLWQFGNPLVSAPVEITGNFTATVESLDGAVSEFDYEISSQELHIDETCAGGTTFDAGTLLARYNPSGIQEDIIIEFTGCATSALTTDPEGCAIRRAPRSFASAWPSLALLGLGLLLAAWRR